MRIEELYSKYLECRGVSTDTRTIEEGDLFVALKGPNFDANQKAKHALEAGALYAIVDDPAVVQSDRYLLVSDGLITLQELAKYQRTQLTIPVVGITGSNGKTTTKELMNAVLSSRYKVGATKGNYNNHIGVPLTILNESRDVELLIVEMGTNQPGDIKELCDISDPDYAIITNIGLAHLELLKSQEGIFHEKTAMFDHVDHKAGHVFLHQDDPWLIQWSGRSAEVINYRSHEVAGTTLISGVDDQLNLTLSLQDDLDSSPREYVTHLSGKYNISNIAAALCVGAHFGVDLHAGLSRISSYIPVNHRSQIIKTDRNTIIADAYNANPSSMSASIRSLCESRSSGSNLLIIGDMLELGDKSTAFHQEIVALADSFGASAIYVGPTFSKIGGAQSHFDTVDDLIASGQLTDIRDKTILVKGSRGIRLEKTFEYL